MFSKCFKKLTILQLILLVATMLISSAGMAVASGIGTFYENTETYQGPSYVDPDGIVRASCYNNPNWRVYESNHFLVYCDQSSDENCSLYGGMVETEFASVKTTLGVTDGELGISTTDPSTKPHVCSDWNAENGATGDSSGISMPALDESNPKMDPLDRLHDFEGYRRFIRHEMTHLFQSTLANDNLDGNKLELWFTEGMAVFIANHSMLLDTYSLAAYYAAGRPNPVTIPTRAAMGSWTNSDLYPAFGLAVKYLFDSAPRGGAGNSMLNIKVFLNMIHGGMGFAEAFDSTFTSLTLSAYTTNFQSLMIPYLGNLQTPGTVTGVSGIGMVGFFPDNTGCDMITGFGSIVAPGGLFALNVSELADGTYENSLCFGDSEFTTMYGPGGFTVSGGVITSSTSYNISDWQVSCLALSPPVESVRFSTTTGTIAVIPLSESCSSWTATSNDAWITIESGSPGDGFGMVEYSVAENLTTDPRTGTITIGGAQPSIFSVEQDIRGSISGEILTGSSVYSGGSIKVAVYDAPWPDGNQLGGTSLTDLGGYTISNLPVNMNLYVYARWDKDSDGTGTRTPGDWTGQPDPTPVVITGGVNLTNIDISLDTLLLGASVSGNILSDDFEADLGDLKVFAYNGPDPLTRKLFEVITIDKASISGTSIPYTFSGATSLAVDGYAYIFARWDKDGDGVSSAVDYRGSYSLNPLLIESGGHTDIDITLNPGAREYAASGTYTFAAPDLAVTTTVSNFTCDGLTVGIEHITVVSVGATTMEWQEDGGNMIWTRDSGTADDIIGTWQLSDGTNFSYTLTILDETDFELTAIISQSGTCVSGLVSVGSSGYDGGDIYVVVSSSAFPDITPLDSRTFTGPGGYGLSGLPSDTDLFVYAYWDQDGSGTGTLTPGDWVGGYPSNPVRIENGVNPTGIDISLDTEIPGLYHFTASGTYDYVNPALELDITSSDFACDVGPSVGIQTFTVVSLTVDEMVWQDGGDNMTWTRTSDEITAVIDGTWVMAQGANSFELTIGSGSFILTASVVEFGQCVFGEVSEGSSGYDSGNIFVAVYDAPFPNGTLLESIILTAPGPYMIGGGSMSAFTVLYVYARWDRDGSGTRTSGDWVGQYASNPVVITGGVNPTDIDIILTSEIPAPQQYTASGTYTYVPDILTLDFLSSDFLCDGPELGVETFTVLSPTATEMVWEESEGHQMTWTRDPGTPGDIVGIWQMVEGLNVFEGTFVGNGTFEVTADIAEPRSCVSGEVDASGSGYDSGNIYVGVYDAPFPAGNPLGSRTLAEPGPYNISDLPSDTDLWVYARWDKDGSGTRTAWDWVGEPDPNPVRIENGVNPTNIDIVLDTEIPGASVSGTVSSSDFVENIGDLLVSAYDGPNRATANLLRLTTIDKGAVNTTSIPYILDDLIVDSYVYIFARWDKDSNGIFSPMDYRGSYPANPLQVLPGGNAGIDIALNPGAEEHTSRGDYTYDDSDIENIYLTLNFQDSDFTCEGPIAGNTETFTVMSLDAGQMVLKDQDANQMTWIRDPAGDAGNIVGTWQLIDGQNSYELTINGDTTFVMDGIIAEAGPCITGQVDAGGSPYDSGNIYVGVYDAAFPGGNLLGAIILAAPGEYEIRGLQADTELYAYAYWDKDVSDTPTPGDWAGEYPSNPVVITGGVNPTGIDISLDNEIPPPPGDINNSGDISLQDAIIALQVTAGMTPGVQVYPGAEVSGDGKIGTAEAAYILQCLSELRPANIVPDTTAPLNTTAPDFINSGAASGSSPSVILSISATDSIGVTGYYASENPTTPSYDAPGWTAVAPAFSYSAEVPFMLSDGASTKTVYVWFKDGAGNVSGSTNDNFELLGITAKWIYTTGGGPIYYSTPAIDNEGTIYVTTGAPFNFAPERGLYAINPDGSLKWSYTGALMPAMSSPVLGADGTVYMQDQNSDLYAVNPNGTLKWSNTTSMSSYLEVGIATPSVGADGTIYAGADSLYAFNPEDGSQKWKSFIPDTGAGPLTFRSGAAIAPDGTIYIGGAGNFGWSNLPDYSNTALVAVNPDDGSVKWQYLVQGTTTWIFSSSAIGDDGTIYLGVETTGDENYVYAINPDGTLKWRYVVDMGRNVRSSPAIGPDGTIYIGTKAGPAENALFLALNPDGSLKWSFRIEQSGADIYCSPTIGADGTIYIGTEDSNLYAFNPDGTVAWKYSTNNGINWTAPAIAADGTIYVGNNDGKLFAIDSESLGLADTPWPKVHHDSRNSGRMPLP